jgi:hypothetical protein
MTPQEQDTFLEYLRSIEDELLEAVTADYIWLVETDDESPVSRFYWRRGACLEECSRRSMEVVVADTKAIACRPIFACRS